VGPRARPAPSSHAPLATAELSHSSLAGNVQRRLLFAGAAPGCEAAPGLAEHDLAFNHVTVARCAPVHAQRRRSAPAAAPGAEAARARAAGTGRVEPEASLADELAGLSPRSAASDDVPGRSPRRYADEDDDEVLAGAGSGLGASTPNTARAGGGSGDGATPFDASLVRASRAAPPYSAPLTT